MTESFTPDPEAIKLSPDFLARQVYDSFYFSQGDPDLADLLLGVLHQNLQGVGVPFPAKEEVTGLVYTMMNQWLERAGNHVEESDKGHTIKGNDKLIDYQASIYTKVLLTGEYANEVYPKQSGMTTIEEKVAVRAADDEDGKYGQEVIADLWRGGVDAELIAIAQIITERDHDLICKNDPPGRPRNSVNGTKSPRADRWLSQAVYYGFVNPEEDPYTIRGIVALAMNELAIAHKGRLYNLRKLLGEVAGAYLDHHPEHKDKIPVDIKSLILDAQPSL